MAFVSHFGCPVHLAKLSIVVWVNCRFTHPPSRKSPTGGSLACKIVAKLSHDVMHCVPSAKVEGCRRNPLASGQFQLLKDSGAT